MLQCIVVLYSFYNIAEPRNDYNCAHAIHVENQAIHHLCYVKNVFRLSLAQSCGPEIIGCEVQHYRRITCLLKGGKGMEEWITASLTTQ